MADRVLGAAGSRWRRASKPQPRKVAVSPQRISDLIGTIYDCVIDPGNWERVLEDINGEFAFANSVLGVFPFRPGVNSVNVSVGVDSEWLALGSSETYMSEAAALWGGAERIRRFPLGEPIVGSQTAAYATRHANRYFCEILEPRGLLDAVVLPIADDAPLMGYAAFNRHHSAGYVGEPEVSALRMLGPHFRRAVTISNLFDMKAVEAATFRSAIDAMSVGVVLVDEDLGVVHANPAAEGMLRNADPIRLLSGTLAVATKSCDEALKATVKQAARDEGELGHRGIGIPAHSKTGDPCVVHVLPLQRGEARSGLAGSAAAALFVVPTDASARLPIDALALIYDLTPAETRVLEQICAGRTQAEIGHDFGLARSTVKTHLLHLFEKTGCRRQADLLRLAARLASPV